MNRAPSPRGLLLIPLALTWFAFLPGAQGQLSPPPDGCYPNFTTAEGCNALQSLTTGLGNTGIGWYSLFANSSGSYNTAIGAGALFFNTFDNNTAVGAGALFANSTGSINTAVGAFALFSNTIGGGNTAVGDSALLRNTEGTNNVAIGANGVLASNLTGNTNTAIGLNALSSNTSGSFNVALGVAAGNSVTTGDNNICIGTEVFGNPGESNAIHIGDSSVPGFTATACFIGGIFGQTATEGTAVFVNSSGQLGTLTSSARFKKEIRPIDNASEAILALNPVTFQYTGDKTNTPRFGLVAEDVAQVNPDLVICDRDGRPYTVRYEAVNAMLLNEFLKARRQIDAQQMQIEALTAGLQKVNAQLELSKAAPRTVLGSH